MIIMNDTANKEASFTHQGYDVLKTLVPHEDHSFTQALSDLVDEGVSFEAKLYTIKATYKGKTYSQTLTTSVNSLLEGKVPEAQKYSNIGAIVSFLTHLQSVVFGTQSIAPVQDGNLTTLLKKSLDKEAKGGVKFAPGVEAPAKSADVVAYKEPTGSVVKLRDATKVGQSVKGTSPDSVYRVLALNERIKIAIKPAPSGLSVRVEWKNPTPGELNRIKSYSWLGVKGDYASGHFNFDENTNARRLFGAMLFDLGLDFTQVTLSPEFFNAN